MLAEPVYGFPAETALLIRRDRPAMAPREDKTGRLTASEARDEIREEADIFRVADRAEFQRTRLQCFVKLFPLLCSANLSRDVVRHHEADARQVSAEFEPRHVNEVDEDVRVCDDDSSRV